MINVRLNNVRSILCLGAHADDIEIGCGGTILKLLKQQKQVNVYWVVLGAQDWRAQEATTSAEKFLTEAGESNIVVKGFRDSFFPYQGEEIKEYFHHLQKQFSPDLIFTHRREDMHQDHRLLAELTWNAFRDNLILEYEIPKFEGDLGHPNVMVSLTEELCQKKVDTIVDSFRSQHEKAWFSSETFWALMRIRGLECNAPEKLAEGLYCRKMVL